MKDLLARLPLISYTERFRVVWNLVVLMAILSYSFVFSYRIVFHFYANDFFYWFITLLFSLDILYNFNVETKHKYRLLTSRRTVARHYLRGWFAVDLLAALPIDLFLYSILPAGSGADLVLVVQAITVVKLIKAVHLLGQLQASLGLAPAIMRLVSFAFWFFQVVHLMALGWILIGAGDMQRLPQDQYLRSLYFVLTTVLTIGYGDYSPNKDSNIQMIFTMVIQFFGVGMYTYIIGNVSGLIANLDLARAALQRKKEEVTDFMRVRRMRRTSRERVLDYFTYLWEHRKSGTSTAFIEELPPSLQLDVLMELNEPLLRKVTLFQGLDQRFVKELVQLLKPVVYLPGDAIIEQGDIGECMYFLSSGDAEVQINGSVVARLGPGSPFGEAAILTTERRNASVVASDYCDVFLLTKQDFDVLRQKFPEFDNQIKVKAEERRQANLHTHN